MINYAYRGVVSHDPELPGDLLPPVALEQRNEAVSLFHELEGRLHPIARQYVTSMLDPDS